MTEEDSSSSSPPAASKNRLKFLCSYGGKILPRPSDGQLKYVGGDTRVVSAPRPLLFSELMEKIGAVFRGDVVVRYQLLGEDLDALVTVKSDDDVQHMLEEYDRQEVARSNASSPTFGGNSASAFTGATASHRFRLFLFPVDLGAADSPPHRQSLLHCGSVEQRYIDAINGVGSLPRRLSGGGGGGFGTSGKSIFTISSGGSSPTSTAPTAYPPAPIQPQPPPPSFDLVGSMGLRRTKPMNKAHSSPNLMQLGMEPPSAQYYNHTPHAQQPHHYHYQQTLYNQQTHNRSSYHLPSYPSSHYHHPHYAHIPQTQPQPHHLPHPHAQQSHHGGGRTTAIPPVASEPLWRMNSGPSINTGTGGGGASSRPGSPALSPQSHPKRRQLYGASGPLTHAVSGFGLAHGPRMVGAPPCTCCVHIDDGAPSTRPRSFEEYYIPEQ